MYQQIRVIFEEQECADLYYEANAAQILVGEGLKGVGLSGKEVMSVKNKHMRIMLTLKPVWDRIHFHESLLSQGPEGMTEEERVTFVSQIAEYTEGPARRRTGRTCGVGGVIQHRRDGRAAAGGA